MKSKRVRNNTNSTNEIPETDFSNGVRDKYASGLKKNGYTIRVYRSDGSFKEKQVPSESLVSLDPDIQAYFPDSTAVNRALRKLISTQQSKHKRAPSTRRSA